MHIRASKKIPSEVAQWTEFMKRQNGAEFFILAAYTNVAGELVTSRSACRNAFRDIPSADTKQTG